MQALASKQTFKVDAFAAALLAIEPGALADTKHFTNPDFVLVGENGVSLIGLDHIDFLYAYVENPPGTVNAFVRVAFNVTSYGYILASGGDLSLGTAVGSGGPWVYQSLGGPLPSFCTGSQPFTYSLSVNPDLVKKATDATLWIATSTWQKCLVPPGP